jgi:dynein heavy chain
MLGDMKFLESLREYNKENIPTEIITKIKAYYLSNPDFNPSLIKNVSSACVSLCKWVIAIIRYDEIFKVCWFFLFYFIRIHENNFNF